MDRIAEMKAKQIATAVAGNRHIDTAIDLLIALKADRITAAKGGEGFYELHGLYKLARELFHIGLCGDGTDLDQIGDELRSEYNFDVVEGGFVDESGFLIGDAPFAETESHLWYQ